MPLPTSERSSRVPASCFTSLATTSMPMPRPASWVSLLAVEKPGSKMKRARSSSESCASGTIKPRSIALWRIAMKSRPRPSSDNSTSSCEPSRDSRRLMVPTSGLPASARSAGSSMPCTTALRSRCSSGAVMRSSTWRSSSASTPWNCASAWRPFSSEVCRTTRSRRCTWRENGTISVPIRPCCTSVVMRLCCSSSVSDSLTASSMVDCSEDRSLIDSARVRDSSCMRE